MKFTTSIRLLGRAAAALIVSVAGATTVSGQVVQLTESSATVLRGGTWANTNLSSDLLLVTRASADATYVRRVALTFDTATAVPAGSSIVSAALTLTVAGGNAQSRAVTAYRLAASYDETAATWSRRSGAAAWTYAGGDLADKAGVATVTNLVGSRVSFDVTAAVSGSVSGAFGPSRFTHLAIVDGGAAARDSYKEYYSDEAGDPAVRPVLTVTYAVPVVVPDPVVPPEPPPVVTPVGPVQLRVLTYNTHHGGYGTDGRYDPNRLANWMVKMTPDVILLTEIEKFTGWGNEDQPARYKALMEAKTGKTWYSLFVQEYGAWTSNGKGHLILSTYPLESWDMFDMSWDRSAGQARITVNGRTISLIATHLDPDDQSRRLTQAKQVMLWATGIAENRILAGDMNAWPDQTSIAEFYKAYNDSWVVAEKAGKAIGFSGLSPAGATKKGRIDYIFYSKLSADLSVVSSQVYDTRDANGVMPSDHRPVLTTFEVR